MTPTAFGPRSLAVAGPNDDPRWRRAERKHGFQAAVENGPAASELRRRCVLLHHGLDPLDPPNTSMWRDGLRPVASSPWVVVHRTKARLQRGGSVCLNSSVREDKWVPAGV